MARPNAEQFSKNSNSNDISGINISDWIERGWMKFCEHCACAAAIEFSSQCQEFLRNNLCKDDYPFSFNSFPSYPKSKDFAQMFVQCFLNEFHQADERSAITTSVRPVPQANLRKPDILLSNNCGSAAHSTERLLCSSSQIKTERVESSVNKRKPEDEFRAIGLDSLGTHGTIPAEDSTCSGLPQGNVRVTPPIPTTFEDLNGCLSSITSAETGGGVAEETEFRGEVEYTTVGATSAEFGSASVAGFSGGTVLKKGRPACKLILAADKTSGAAPVVLKEGCLNQLIYDTNALVKWERCRLALVKAPVGYLLEFYVPPKSSKAKTGLFCFLITEARFTTAKEISDEHTSSFVLKYGTSAEYVLRAADSSGAKSWLEAIKSCSGDRALVATSADGPSSPDLIHSMTLSAPLPENRLPENEFENVLVSRQSMWSYPWFHGQISRTEASRLVLSRGIGGHGVFLLRQSETHTSEYVLTFNCLGEGKHLRLSISNNGQCRLRHLHFESAQKFIDYFRSKAIQLDNTSLPEVKLTDFVPRQDHNSTAGSRNRPVVIPPRSADDRASTQSTLNRLSMFNINSLFGVGITAPQRRMRATENPYTLS